MTPWRGAVSFPRLPRQPRPKTAGRGAGIGPTLQSLSEEVVDCVQAEKAGDNQIDRHGDADDAGRDQQKHARGQGDEWQEGAGCIGMHLPFIPDSMALARSTVTWPCAGVDPPRHDSLNRRGFDMIDLGSAGFAAFMKADDEDNGKALKSLGLAK